VAVPTPFNQTWLAHKLAGKVLGALYRIEGSLQHFREIPAKRSADDRRETKTINSRGPSVIMTPIPTGAGASRGYSFAPMLRLYRERDGVVALEELS